MSNYNYKSLSIQSSSKIGPLIVWIMIALIPSIIGTQLFKYIDKTRQEIDQAKEKQNLLTEAYKYNKYLNTKSYLLQALEINNTQKLYDKWINKNATFNQIRKKHVILKKLPSFKGNINVELDILCKLLQVKLKALPNAIFVFSEKLEECQYVIKKPFAHKFSDTKMKESLKIASGLIRKKLIAARVKKSLPKELRRFTFEEFTKSLGILQAIHVELHSLSSQYSMLTNDFIYIVSYAIETDNNQLKLIQLIYDTHNLSAKSMLNNALNIANKGNFLHKFGWTKTPSLPLFEDINGNTVLTCALPELFQKLCKKRHFTKTGYQPIIRISAKKPRNNLLRHKTILLIVKLYLLITLLFSIGFSLQQFAFFTSLKTMMTIAFIAGILFPVTNLVWLSLSYIYVHEEKASENQQMLMKNKIDEFEDELRLEKFKQNTYVRFIANQIEKYSYKKRLNAHKYIPFNNKTPKSSKMRWNFYSLLTTNADGTTVFRYRDRQKMTQLTEGNTAGFLKGPFIQALSRLNAYNSLSANKQKKLIQMAEILIEMISDIFDSSSISVLLANSGDFITKDYTVGETYLNTFILRDQKNKPNGICSFNSDNSGCFNKFKERYHGENYYKPFKKYYKENGFSTVLYLLETNKLRDREIKTVSGQDEKFNSINISNIAASLFAKSDTCQINNLNHNTQPHIIVGEFLSDLHIYAIAYSVPLKTSDNMLLFVAIIILIFLILISAIALAQGVASVLLINIPQFSEAISKSENQNYQWRININSGNEFEKLANAFNGMASKMQERQKLGELVSQNVIDAISSDNDNMLKPGGERVHASILFADIRGFTTISETYSADEVVEMLNGYFTVMSEIIEKHGGIIDKFIGDAIQAVFYENNRLNTSLRATEAAVEMRSALKKFNIQRTNTNKFLIDNGIGITTGQVISGRVGTVEGKLDATVIGSKLIYAMELESLSKFAKSTPILLDQNTKDNICKQYNTIDFIAPKESQLTISIFELKI